MTTKTIKTADELFETIQSAKSDHARTLIAHAGDAALRYEAVRRELEGSIKFCHEQLGRALQELQIGGQQPNSLGLLQNNGAEVDRLCGELARTREAAAATQQLLVRVGILPADEDLPTIGERLPDGSWPEKNCTM
jgi:hypothetical protein